MEDQPDPPEFVRSIRKLKREHALRLMAIRDARLLPLASSASGHERLRGPGRPGWLPTQVPHRSGRVEQETHLVTPPRPTSQVPIIGFSALLQLLHFPRKHRTCGDWARRRER